MDGVDLIQVAGKGVLGKLDGLGMLDLLGGGICCCLSKVVAQRLHLGKGLMLAKLSQAARRQHCSR